ncbi:AAA family ATPase, partial [Candidatus Uhrbacteria bacterium]|nr:AAA family ATPase [Candidatus Uhrbacteria bacterium]
MPIRPISERIGAFAGAPPERKKESLVSAEQQAEELFALYRDVQRTKSVLTNALKEKNQIAIKTAEETLLRLREKVAERWHDPQVRSAFEKGIERSSSERAQERVGRQGHDEYKEEAEQAKDQRLALLRTLFANREQEPDELSQMDLEDCIARENAARERMKFLEKADPALAAHLSFERLKKYRDGLKQGFAWTPSREKYLDQMFEHLVIFNQNRPLLLYGESGTGKTRLVREASKILTGKPPEEVGEEAKSDIRPLLGVRSIKDGKDFVTYGPLGRAATGKETSLSAQADNGAIFFMDEMNGYPGDALRSLIKQMSGRKPGEELSFSAWYGQKEKLAKDFAFIGSGNLASEKHPDRAPLPNELIREMGMLKIGYFPQSASNPELYELMLGALMDQNDRIRASKEDVAPVWEEAVNADKTEKTFHLDLNPKAGGTLWRFANFLRAAWDAYERPADEQGEKLAVALLDPGLAFSWISSWRKTAARSGKSLQTYLYEKISDWRQKDVFPEEDRVALIALAERFALSDSAKTEAGAFTNLSPNEIGALSPRVPRPPEKLVKIPSPDTFTARRADGSRLDYRRLPTADGMKPGDRYVRMVGEKKQEIVFAGIMKDAQLVFELPGGVFESMQTGEVDRLEPVEDVDGLLEDVSSFTHPSEALTLLEKRGRSPDLSREMRSLFADSFFGPDEIESAFTVKDAQGTPKKLIELTPQERQ